MPISTLPLDPTGENVNNLVTNDIFPITPDTNTVIVPSQGLYFADTLIVKDASTNFILTRNTDYACIELSGEMTGKYGQEVCNAVICFGTYGTTSVNLTYQALGSQSGSEVPQMQQLLQNLTASQSQLEWLNILNKPLLYTPNNHVNMLSDIYGFEPVVYAIERLTDILKLGRVNNYELIMEWVNSKLATFCYQMSTLQYNVLGSAQVSMSYSMNGVYVVNSLAYQYAPNGMTAQWSLSNNINDISASYFPLNGILAVDNHGAQAQTGEIEYIANNGIVPGTVLSLNLNGACQSSSIVLAWLTYTNGFPDPANSEYSLATLESDYYPIIKPTTSKSFNESFNSGRVYNSGQ